MSNLTSYVMQNGIKRGREHRLEMATLKHAFAMPDAQLASCISEEVQSDANLVSPLRLRLESAVLENTRTDKALFIRGTWYQALLVVDEQGL